MITRNALCAPCILLALACGSDKGEGTVTVTAYGEAFIEEGIPADEVDDGWAVTFDRFVVRVQDVRVAGTSIDVVEKIDLSKPSKGKGHELGSALVAEGEYTHGAFTLGKIDVRGSATKGDVKKTFAWVFDETTRYDECETTTTVKDGGNTTFQITIHADHLLYDSLVSEEPRVLFQALADADVDGDGDITKQELEATDIGNYDAGSEKGANDLWAWLNAQVRSLGHIDGEGHCHADSLK